MGKDVWPWKIKLWESSKQEKFYCEVWNWSDLWTLNSTDPMYTLDIHSYSKLWVVLTQYNLPFYHMELNSRDFHHHRSQCIDPNSPSNIATSFSRKACSLYELSILGRVSPLSAPITHHFVIVNHWKRFGFIGVVPRRFLCHKNYAFTTQFLAKYFSLSFWNQGLSLALNLS